MFSHKSCLALLCLLLPFIVSAQFQFFDQMFQGQHHEEHQAQQKQNVASDSNWFRKTYLDAHCTNYLCPDTLACVHFPHHCPCTFPNTEEKIELGEAGKICVSRGGFIEGEASKKVDLARRGML